ncbi:hypothetical protein, partial [Pseudomonas sp. AH2 (2023)]|uniref:hypothetical protein n=1 Tax=Pseudomonas sp. AH2 (2023) TaxID=3048599 RepID=UPI002B23769C
VLSCEKENTGEKDHLLARVWPFGSGQGFGVVLDPRFGNGAGFVTIEKNGQNNEPTGLAIDSAKGVIYTTGKTENGDAYVAAYN